MSVIRSYKRKYWRKIAEAGWMVISLISVVGFVMLYQKYEECQGQLELREREMASYQRNVYSATKNLPKGTIITEENVCQELRYMDVPQELFVSQDVFGKRINHDVEKGTCLTDAMLEYDNPQSREVFISEIDIPEFLQSGDRVDIRIRYNNAEDYTVLVDKILVRCTASGGMVLELSEEEILLISSAIADKNVYDNTKLYAVKYPENKSQESGEITYIANKEVLKILKKEKKEGESRTALEERLMLKQ